MADGNSEYDRLTRRESLLKLGGLAATVAGAGAWAGHELLDAPTAGAAGTGPAAVASGLVSCVLAPEMTEGPYYVDGDKYSEEAALSTAGQTFLRGIQRTDAKGLAIFRTIYPGWYMGRTVHIHVKVYLGGRTVHTGQLFFPDSLTDAVYRRSPYNRRPGRDTRNATDSIFRNGGKRSLLVLRKSGNGYTGRITMGVSRS